MNTTPKMTYSQWFEHVEKTAAETEVGKRMIAAGFHVAHTGGGCLAWERDIDNGYLWVCDEGNGLGDKLDEAYLLGIYVADNADNYINDECNGIELAIRWCLEAETALNLCRKWVKRIGLGFHLDTRGASYDPPLNADEVKEYDADVEKVMLAPGDPYAFAVRALQEVAR